MTRLVSPSLLLGLLAFGNLASSACRADPPLVQVRSPNGQVHIELVLQRRGDVDAVPHWRLHFQDHVIIQVSRLGVELAEGPALGGPCDVESVTTRSRHERYTVFPGKRRHALDHCAEAVVSLRERTPPGRRWEPARTLASYVVYQNHLPMVSDYSSAYRGHPGLAMLAKVPSSWDDTRFLAGAVGEYVALARRDGADWYVGAMNGLEARDVAVPLRFLGPGRYRAEVYADDPEKKTVHQLAQRTEEVAAGDTLTLRMEAAGGGLVRLAPLPAKRGGMDETGAYRQGALEAARWVRSTAVKTERGAAWPADSADGKTVNSGLYNGVSGTLLFFLEAHRSTREKTYLDDARAGADYLLRSVEGEKQSGLYVGLAGVGFALQEAFKVTGEARYRDGARRCLALLAARARRAGKGVEWNESTDVISGTAGIGLFLLYAAREWKDESARKLAAQAGERLIELGRPAPGGLKWAMRPGFDRLMPNFSHGTAGAAYFLASLYLETKHKPFLDAALAGGKYLQAVANTEGGACLVFHNESGGEKLFYLGWCHGPVGTARLFYRLYQSTGDREWMGWVDRCGRAVLRSGLPEKRPPGLWDNVGQCCGSAGVAEFCLDLHRVTKDRQYLELARSMTDDILRRSTRDDKGTHWRGAEHRVKPELLTVQTGYMQGAAGVGMWLLHLDGFDRGREERITLPDSPF